MENEIEEGGESSGLVARDCNNKDIDKFSGETPTDSPTISSKGDTPIPEASGSHEVNDGLGLTEEEKTWPSVVDLNTRLRRVISSYQRNVKKDDVVNKMIQKPKICNEVGETSNHNVTTTTTTTTTTMTTNVEPPLNMQGWDLQQLAMYLLVSINYKTKSYEYDKEIIIKFSF